jgi:spore germination protein KB
MEIKQIGNFQAIALILIIVINHLVLGTPRTIISETGTGTILNMIYVFILAIIFVLILNKLFNNFKGKDIIDVSEFLGGKVLKVIVGIVFIGYFLVILSTTIRVIVQDLEIIYFENISICIITLVILASIVFVYKYGSSAVIKCNSIIAPIAGIAILVIAFSNIKDFSLDRIFPILGFSVKETFITGASNIFAYSGIAVLYFIMPMLKDSRNFKKVSIISVVLVGILIIGSVASLVLSFPFIEDINEISSLYIESRDINYWQVFQRIDGVFVFSWILALLSYISVVLFIIVLIFRKLTNTKKEFPVVLAFATITYVITLIPDNINMVRFLENVVFKYSNIIVAIFLNLLILILANIKYKIINKNKEVDLEDEKLNE